MDNWLFVTKDICAGGSEDRAYYLPGVGSPYGPQDSDLLEDNQPDRNFLSEAAIKKSALAASKGGLGANEQIMHAYVELAKNFEPGDKIAVVGFSRGACAARSFCGLLNRCGVQARQHGDTDKSFARRIHKEYKIGAQTGESVPVDACVCFDSVKGEKSPGRTATTSRPHYMPSPIISMTRRILMNSLVVWRQTAPAGGLNTWPKLYPDSKKKG